MNNNSRHNAITQRLEMLTSEWSDFAADAKHSVLRWLIQYDEVRMIDAFFEMESSEHGTTPDLFLRFETPFENPSQYAFSLTKQLVDVVENDKPYLEKENVFINWQPSNQRYNTPNSFFQMVSSFGKSLEDFEGLIVVFLQPNNIDVANTKAYNEWLSQAIEVRIPENVRIMLQDLADYPLHDKLAQQFSKKIKTIEPRLDMAAAIQQLASAGNPNDPDVQFRKVFVEMSVCASKGKMEKMEQLSERALDIAKLEGWDHLQVAVHSLLGTTWLGKSDFDQALNKFSKARVIAESAYEKQDPLAGKLLIQVLFYEGAALFSKRNYAAAVEKYKTAIPIAEKLEEVFYQVEALRMSANCYEMLGKNQQALDDNKKALNLAAQLDEQIRLNSTLPYIGVSILKLLKKLSLDNEIPFLKRKMNQLVGEQDWESIPPSKRVAI